ncbi:MAG TPA: phage portal protein [Caldisericia bacterium]|nr:phage portal protein [Caldisericia bacterium]
MIKEVLKRAGKAFLSSIMKSSSSINPYEDATFFKTLRELAGGRMQTNPYTESVWVFASINAIAQNVARVPFNIYKEEKFEGRGTRNKTKEKILVDEGELYELFLNPNKYMHTNLLFYATLVYLELFGEAFWFMPRRNVTEVPSEITVISPQRMFPFFEEDERGNKIFNGRWKYKPVQNGFAEVLEPHEILQFKYFDPFSDIRGISPYKAAKSGIEQDYLASEYNRQFFGKGVGLSGIVKVNGFLNDEQFRRLKEQFREEHSGIEKAHQITVIENADFIETKSLSQRDMEFSILKRVIREEILAAYKTNEVILGVYSNIQSYEGIKNAHLAFWRETIIPKINFFQEYLWAKFFYKINGGREWGEFDLSVVEALRSDFIEKVNTARTLYGMGYPINVINEKLDLGLPRVDWGDVWWTSSKNIPATLLIGNNKPEKEPEKESEKEEETGSKSTVFEDFSYLSERQSELEDYFNSKLKRFIFEQRKRILKDKKLDEKFEKEQLYEVFKDAYLRTMTVAVETFSLETLKEIEIDDEIRSIVDKKIETDTNSLLKSILFVIKNVKQNEIFLKKVYNKIESKVSLIVKTEITELLNEVRFSLMQKFGIKKHRWICLRDRHKNLHRKIVNVGESFLVGDKLLFPACKEADSKDVLGCSCFTVPVE